MQKNTGYLNCLRNALKIFQSFGNKFAAESSIINSLTVIKQQTSLLIEKLSNYQTDNNSKWLDVVFNSLLGREPDPEARVFYLGKLNNGDLDREDVMNAVLTSNEYVNIIRERERLLGGFVKTEWKPEHFDNLVSLQLEVTTYCNLQCVMCEKSWASARGFKHLSPKLLSKIDVLSNKTHVGLFGFGEPLMNPDIWNIIQKIPNKNLCGFTTNGTLLTKNICEKIIRNNIGWINVSLDGATSDTAQKIRGTGGKFDWIIGQLSFLVANRTESPEISINMTIMKENMHEILLFCKLAYKIGVDRVQFAPLNPTIPSRTITTFPNGEVFDYKSNMIMVSNNPNLKILLIKAKRYCDANNILFCYSGDYSLEV